jgi:hypothetical protein
MITSCLWEYLVKAGFNLHLPDVWKISFQFPEMKFFQGQNFYYPFYIFLILLAPYHSFTLSRFFLIFKNTYKHGFPFADIMHLSFSNTKFFSVHVNVHIKLSIFFIPSK